MQKLTESKKFKAKSVKTNKVRDREKNGIKLIRKLQWNILEDRKKDGKKMKRIGKMYPVIKLSGDSSRTILMSHP